jgi:hypothetical protein
MSRGRSGWERIEEGWSAFRGTYRGVEVRSEAVTRYGRRGLDFQDILGGQRPTSFDQLPDIARRAATYRCKAALTARTIDCFEHRLV